MWGIDFTRFTGRHHSSEQQTVRVGARLSDEDRQTMFVFVRSILNRVDPDFGGHEETADNAIVFSDTDRLVTLSVSFWIGGALRGCMVVHHLPLKEALKKATLQAARDSRFKPVRKEELAGVRIEISLLNLLQSIPLHQLRQQKNIDPKKGYRFSYQNQQGWLLPEVFNCLRFRGIDDFLRILITEKAGLRIDKQCLARGRIEIFEVEDLIESEDLDQIRFLNGPVVRSNRGYTSFDERFIEDLEALLHRVAQQLLFIQEDDGNIPPILDPLSGKIKQIDWVRLACVTTALSVFDKVTENEKYHVATKKAGQYISKYGYNHPSLALYTKTLCRVYYAEYLFAVGRTDEAKSIAWEVLKQIDFIRFEPIFLLKAASLLLLFEEKDFLRKSETLFESVWNDFLQKKNESHVELARFPELVAVAKTLFVRTHENQYQEKRRQVTEWLVSLQHLEGSFPSVTGGVDFAYTRGTGKIFEVLALDPQGNQESILRTFGWLQDMQYTKENTFFVKPGNQEKILGGFRHDVFNQEVWIDASAHVLLGGARLLQALKGKGKID